MTSPYDYEEDAGADMNEAQREKLLAAAMKPGPMTLEKAMARTAYAEHVHRADLRRIATDVHRALATITRAVATLTALQVMLGGPPRRTTKKAKG
jgi:hypothetical protein